MEIILGDINITKALIQAFPVGWDFTGLPVSAEVVGLCML